MSALDGKVVMITGAARGQGRAHALASANAGAAVSLIDVPDPIPSVRYPLGTLVELQQTAADVEELGQEVLTAAADVRSQKALDAAVAATLERFGRLDCLIVNHGIWSGAPFWELTESDWDDMLAVNLTAIWKAAKAVAPTMRERGSGSIVITSSMNGIEPGAGYAHYSTAKSGAFGLMRNIALELAPSGVRCNAVAPGVIDTPMLDNAVARDTFAGHAGGTVEEMHAAGAHYHALRGMTLLPAEAVAQTALWLNSDAARWITGVTVPVDAGHALLAGFNHAPAR